jgi:hypothetical protein
MDSPGSRSGAGSGNPLRRLFNVSKAEAATGGGVSVKSSEPAGRSTEGGEGGEGEDEDAPLDVGQELERQAVHGCMVTRRLHAAKCKLVFRQGRAVADGGCVRGRRRGA